MNDYLERIAIALERIADKLDLDDESEAWARYFRGDGPKPR